MPAKPNAKQQEIIDLLHFGFDPITGKMIGLVAAFESTKDGGDWGVAVSYQGDRLTRLWRIAKDGRVWQI